jgi:hypothetical protein
MQHICDELYTISSDVLYTQRENYLFIVKTSDDDNVFKLSGTLIKVFLGLASQGSPKAIFEKLTDKKASADDLKSISSFIEEMLRHELLTR